MSGVIKGLPRHVFISYPFPDKELSEKVVKGLKFLGYNTWIDVDDLEPGTPNWQQEIREAVKDSYALVLICTPNTIQSQHVQAELKLAEKHNLKIFPVWINGNA